MAYFMCQYCGQLRFIVQIGQQAAVNIDIPPWSGKGVNVRAVDNSKGKGTVGVVTAGDQTLADAIDIGL